jgi:hypothetical protein
MKDSDLNRNLLLSEQDRSNFLQQIENDASFLRDNNIMDYSLLLGKPRSALQPRFALCAHFTVSSCPPCAPACVLVWRLGIHFSKHVVAVEEQTERIEKRDAGANTGKFTRQEGGGTYGTSELKSPSSGNLGAGGVGSPSGSAGAGIRTMFQRDHGGLRARLLVGPGVYFFGIIDILQEYNTGKKIERFFKVYFRLKDPEGISAVPPIPYCFRFVEAMNAITQQIDYTDVSGQVLESNYPFGNSPPPTVTAAGGASGGGVAGGGGVRVGSTSPPATVGVLTAASAPAAAAPTPVSPSMTNRGGDSSNAFVAGTGGSTGYTALMTPAGGGRPSVSPSAAPLGQANADIALE